jgi:alkylmercury lyase
MAEPLARALLRALAQGRPVAEPALTTAADRWPNVELDDRGRVVAFGGLSLTPTAHRFTVGGRRLYTWCAWDTLFLPALLDQPALVESSCAVTGAQVRLAVDRSGVRDVDPEDLWISFPTPGAVSTADITATFCCHVHFIAGRPAADRWLGGHAGASVLGVRDAFELGRLATRCCA